MEKYLKENRKLFIFLFLLILLSGPFFSFIMNLISGLLNKRQGDWLNFYGSISSVVISLLVIHFQLYTEKMKELKKCRPEFSVSNGYQLLKANCKVYFNDKYWFHLEKKQDSHKFVGANSFEEAYSSANKRDKAFAIEIMNNQPIFNLHIIFGDDSDRQIIPKLDVNERIYVISKEHQKRIHERLTSKNVQFNHIPQEIKLYYTTLAGEINCYCYTVNEKGYCYLAKKEFSVDYPINSDDNSLCDYFLIKE